MSTKNGWKTQSGFIWAVLGSVVGFANVLSFSAQCYRNGGGAFLIPYFVAYLMLGLPMLLLEGLIGQKFALPLVGAYGKKPSQIGRFVGWIAVLSCLTIGAFYIVLTGYSALYALFSANGSIPADTSFFFKYTFLHATASLTEFGSFAWAIFLVSGCIAGFVFWTMIRDISKGVEKICSMVMPLMAVLICTFAIASSFLPGALDGIYRFLAPDFAKLGDISLWRDVFGQIFFSLSLGLGIITGYARYNGDTVELKKSMQLVAAGDFIISFIAGWVVFACIGYMSSVSGVPFEQMVASDSAFEIGFIIFPKILQTFTPTLQPILGLAFFLCVFVAGITGVFSIAESVSGNLERELDMPRTRAVAIAMSCMLAMAALFCMGNGQHIIGALSPMVLGLTMIFSALVEIIFFLYFMPSIRDDAIWYHGQQRTMSFFALKYVVPVILLCILIGSVLFEVATLDMGFMVRWCWFAMATVVATSIVSRENYSHGVVADVNA